MVPKPSNEYTKNVHSLLFRLLGCAQKSAGNKHASSQSPYSSFGMRKQQAADTFRTSPRLFNNFLSFFHHPFEGWGRKPCFLRAGTRSMRRSAWRLSFPPFFWIKEKKQTKNEHARASRGKKEETLDLFVARWPRCRNCGFSFFVAPLQSLNPLKGGKRKSQKVKAVSQKCLQPVVLPLKNCRQRGPRHSTAGTFQTGQTTGRRRIWDVPLALYEFLLPLCEFGDCALRPVAQEPCTTPPAAWFGTIRRIRENPQPTRKSKDSTPRQREK